MSDYWLLGVEEGHGDIDTLHRQLGPREAWGSWTEAERTEYLRMENAERRGYHPILKPLYFYRATEVEGHGLSVSARAHGDSRHHMGLKKRGEVKVCSVHDLALPHTKRNRNSMVKCVRCEMRWGPLVSGRPKGSPRVPLAWWEGPNP